MWGEMKESDGACGPAAGSRVYGWREGLGLIERIEATSGRERAIDK